MMRRTKRRNLSEGITKNSNDDDRTGLKIPIVQKKFPIHSLLPLHSKSALNHSEMREIIHVASTQYHSTSKDKTIILSTVVMNTKAIPNSILMVLNLEFTFFQNIASCNTYEDQKRI
jgi:hypothetical protein